jgi:hypothetical protein
MGSTSRHPYRTFCKSVSAAFHNADASHVLGEGPVIVNERTFKDVVFRTRITVDLESMMPSRFVYYQQLDGRTRPLIELTSEHEEFAGIYLPIRIGFRTVEFLSPGKELDAFGSLKIRWRTVNERIYLPSANDLSSQDKLMEFLGETTN